MKLSIIVPAFNESKTLPTLISRLERVNLPHSKEIIIIDDGSTDKTKSILKKIDNKKNIIIITNYQNLGKGASIIKGLKRSSGDLIIIQDADLEYNPNEFKKLLKPFVDKKVQVVYGSRVLKKNPVSHWTFNLGGRTLTFLTNFLFKTNITDEPTGYKVFRSQLIKSLNLKSQGFEFCPEVTAKIARRKIKIYEIPISYHPRPVNEKKIKWLDGLAAIFYLIKYRFID